MKYLFLLTLAMLAGMVIFSSYRKKEPNLKTKPDHVGVDSNIKPYVDEYIELAREYNIKFTKTVTVGFSHLPSGVIGMCTMQSTFREIDIDSIYWLLSSNLSRKIVVFHELTHCYCNRMHDWGFGIPYSMEPNGWNIHNGKMNLDPGYYFDGCPLSIMNPYSVNDTCAKNHYKDYTNEMFNRCIPY